MKTTAPPSPPPLFGEQYARRFPARSMPEQPTFDSFPKFPSLQEVADHHHHHKVAPHPLLRLTEALPKAPAASLFQGLLGGKLDVLQEDALRNPDRYDERTRVLLADMGEKRDYQPTGDELRILDDATLDFASARPMHKPGPILPQEMKKPAQQQPRRLFDDRELDGREPTVETPGGTMSAYWWLS